MGDAGYRCHDGPGASATTSRLSVGTKPHSDRESIFINLAVSPEC
jgi:hypothetical protein